MTESERARLRGHRTRAKAEFRARGLEGMSDHKVLELLLIYGIPQADVKPLARALIEQFGSLSGVLSASYEQLTAVRGMGEHTATLLTLVTAIGLRVLEDRANVKEALRENWQLREILAPCFFGARCEMAWMACLDAKFRLINCKKLSEGDAFSTGVAPRDVLAAALGCNAAIVVLAHNHITGEAVPSAADVAATASLCSTLDMMGICLLDHFIEADGILVSMRESGYFDQFDR